MEPLLTTQEAARLLGLSPRTLAVWRSKGVGPPFRRFSHKCIRYDQAELLDWSAQRSSLSPLERLAPHARALARDASDPEV